MKGQLVIAASAATLAWGVGATAAGSSLAAQPAGRPHHAVQVLGGEHLVRLYHYHGRLPKRSAPARPDAG